MNITLDQARALIAIAENGSLSKAAALLGKRHSAVVYTIKEMEKQTRLKLLDRGQYRSQLTGEGRRVLEICRKLIETEKDLERLCVDLHTGWEPKLRVVYEGILPFTPITNTMKKLTQKKIPTHFEVFSDFHRGLEKLFHELKADFLVSIVPAEKGELQNVRLTPINAILVAAEEHPLALASEPYTHSELQQHTLITVRGSDPRLNLSTTSLETKSLFQVSDFHSKKQAILAGLGYGWLPEYLISQELKTGKLKAVSWSKASTHTFFPALYHREGCSLGRAARLFLEEFTKQQMIPDCAHCVRTQAKTAALRAEAFLLE